jgi:hypothetical protein
MMKKRWLALVLALALLASLVVHGLAATGAGGKTINLTPGAEYRVVVKDIPTFTFLKLGPIRLFSGSVNGGALKQVVINENGLNTAVLQCNDKDLRALKLTVNEATKEIKLDMATFLFCRSFEKDSVTLVVNAPVKALQMGGAAPVDYQSASVSAFNLNMSGSGKGDFAFGSLDRLTANVSGSGHLTFAGKGAARAEYTISGSGNFNAQGLPAKALDAKISGSGHVAQTMATGSTTALRVSGSAAIALEGGAGQADYDVSGSAAIHAYGMEAKNVAVKLSGSVLLEQKFASGAGKLSGEASGASIIRYINLPNVENLKTTGSVKLEEGK